MKRAELLKASYVVVGVQNLVVGIAFTTRHPRPLKVLLIDKTLFCIECGFIPSTYHADQQQKKHIHFLAFFYFFFPSPSTSSSSRVINTEYNNNWSNFKCKNKKKIEKNLFIVVPSIYLNYKMIIINSSSPTSLITKNSSANNKRIFFNYLASILFIIIINTAVSNIAGSFVSLHSADVVK